jgi:hypothetical protein
VYTVGAATLQAGDDKWQPELEADPSRVRKAGERQEIADGQRAASESERPAAPSRKEDEDEILGNEIVWDGLGSRCQIIGAWTPEDPNESEMK